MKQRQSSLLTATGGTNFQTGDRGEQEATDTEPSDEKEDYEIVEGTFKHATPKEEIIPIAEIVGGFDLDPCACDDSHLARTNIRNEGGLQADWGEYGVVFANHPYKDGEAKKWHKKAYQSDADTAILMSRGSMSSNWFHEQALKADLICIPQYRVTFVGYDNQSGFPIVYCVYGDYSAELREYFSKIGWVIGAPSETNQSVTGTNELFAKKEDEPQTENRILPKIASHDELKVYFDSPTKIKENLFQDVLLQPLSRRFVSHPDPLKGDETELNYFELTGVLQHDDGTETWFVLSQDIEDPETVHCYINRNLVWESVEINRIKANEEFDNTPPSSNMIVC